MATAADGGNKVWMRPVNAASSTAGSPKVGAVEASTGILFSSLLTPHEYPRLDVRQPQFEIDILIVRADVGGGSARGELCLKAVGVLRSRSCGPSGASNRRARRSIFQD